MVTVTLLGSLTGTGDELIVRIKLSLSSLASSSIIEITNELVIIPAINVTSYGPES